MIAGSLKCTIFYIRRPSWIRGYISAADARFLFGAIQRERPSLVLEIGTASGFSAAFLCCALDAAAGAGLLDPEFKVVTLDHSTAFYADPKRRVGDAAREQLEARLLRRISFRNPAVAADAGEAFGVDEVPFAFIDADHRHPWPALDLLAILGILSPGAVVMLHDINLPQVWPRAPVRGASYLFNDLELEKLLPDCWGAPNIGQIKIPQQKPSWFPNRSAINIGQIRIPQDKEALRGRLIEIVRAHSWEAQVPASYLDRLGIAREVHAGTSNNMRIGK